MEQQQQVMQALQAEMQQLKQASEESSIQAEEAKKIAKEMAKEDQETRQVAKDVQIDAFGIPLVTPVDTADDPRFKLSITGQAHRQIYCAMDSNKNKVYHTDSDNWPTLVNIAAEGKVNDDLTMAWV